MPLMRRDQAYMSYRYLINYYLHKQILVISRAEHLGKKRKRKRGKPGSTKHFKFA